MLFTGEIIRSRQNKNIVELCKLTDRKAREATKTFRFDGIKLLEEAIKNDVEICAVFLSASAQKRVLDFLHTRFGKEPDSAISAWAGVPSSSRRRAMRPMRTAPAVCELLGPTITGPSISKRFMRDPPGKSVVYRVSYCRMNLRAQPAPL